MVMNPAEELSTVITRALPDAGVSIDAPAHEGGHWWVDVTREGRTATIEWRPKQGFGVGFGQGGYGEGPDVVVPTVTAAAAQVVNYLLSPRPSTQRDCTVLVASVDYPWRSAIEEHLRIHRVCVDAVGTLTEAYERALNQAYAVVVVDLAAELSSSFWELRDFARNIDSVVVTVATSEHVSALEDAFEVIMNKRIGTEYVASVVESLVAASASEQSSDESSEST